MRISFEQRQALLATLEMVAQERFRRNPKVRIGLLCDEWLDLLQSHGVGGEPAMNLMEAALLRLDIIAIQSAETGSLEMVDLRDGDQVRNP